MEDGNSLLNFSLDHIVPPNEIYQGLSDGQWAALWCNWLFSDLEQNGPVCFLRGNVDSEPPVVCLGEDGLTLIQILQFSFLLYVVL